MARKSPQNHFTEFGQTTKARRLELGMTQEQVAEQVGVKPNYIGYLERGMRKPSDEICCRIADALGLDQKELFYLANPHVRAIIDPPHEPRSSAWETFSRDPQLHRRQAITPEEMAVLEAINRLGQVQEPRDFLFLLKTIRQAFSRG